MKAFAPIDDPKGFRTALSRFATGVTIVTALEKDGRPIGMTANSFASLSLDPALVLWSPAKQSARHDAFVAAKAFNIHVLAADQQAICDTFTKNKYGFSGHSTQINQDGVPIIAGCLAVFECHQFACHDAGDHTLILGKVINCRAKTGTPLLFLNGQFETTD